MTKKEETYSYIYEYITDLDREPVFLYDSSEPLDPEALLNEIMEDRADDLKDRCNIDSECKVSVVIYEKAQKILEGTLSVHIESQCDWSWRKPPIMTNGKAYTIGNLLEWCGEKYGKDSSAYKKLQEAVDKYGKGMDEDPKTPFELAELQLNKWNKE